MQHVLHFDVYHFAHYADSGLLVTADESLETRLIAIKPCRYLLVVRPHSSAELVLLHVAEIL